MDSRGLRRFSLGDLFAGLSVAGVLLPEAVAYAAIAQVPTYHALIAALVGLCVYPWLGRSRFAIVAPTSSAAAVFASAVAAGGVDMGYALVLLTAGLFWVAGLLRLEFIGAFISRPVLRGFAWALAMTIVAKQLPHVLGVHASGGTLVQVLQGLWAALPHAQPLSVVCGAVALAVWQLLRHMLHRWVWLPPSLIVLALGVAASVWLDLGAQGVALVGRIEWHTLTPHWPQVSLDAWQRAAELAPALLLILFAESWGAARSLALQNHDDISPRSELLALGAANLASALLQGLPVGAGFSAASANAGSGGRSQWAGVAAAGALALLLWQARGALALLPVPVLAAVVIGILSHSLWPHTVLEKLRLGGDAWLALVAAVGVVVFGVLFGMLLAVALSLVIAIQRFSAPVVVVLGRLPGTRDFVNVAQHAEAQTQPGVLVMRADEPLFFANAEAVLKRVTQTARRQQAQQVVLSLEMSDWLDSTSLEALAEFALTQRAEGRGPALARVKDGARQGLLRCGLAGTAGCAVPLFWSVDDAVNAVGAATP